MKINLTINIDDRLIKSVKKFFSRRNIIIFLLLGVSSAVVVYAASITKPRPDFIGGDTIFASDLNENFDTLYTKVNELDASVTGLNTSVTDNSTSITNLQSNISNISAKVKPSSNQSIPNGSSTYLNFNSELFDTSNLHDIAVNNDRFTITTPGLYLISARIPFFSNSNGLRVIELIKNSNIMIDADLKSPHIGALTYLHVSEIEYLVANDTVSVRVYQNSGGSLGIYGGYSHFSIVKLAD